MACKTRINLVEYGLKIWTTKIMFGEKMIRDKITFISEDGIKTDCKNIVNGVMKICLYVWAILILATPFFVP